MKMGKAVVISGYPGTGKTILAGELRKFLGKEEKIIEVDEEAKKRKLFIAYDAKRGSHVYDLEYLEKWLSEEVNQEEGVTFIFSLTPCILPGELVSLVFVLRGERDEIGERLKMRGWSEEKIEENLEAMDVHEIEEEAEECYGKDKVRSLNTSGKLPREIATLILEETRKQLQK
ncbi:MAG: AAA family ATPase [Fervidicoccaceae archaeon]